MSDFDHPRRSPNARIVGRGRRELLRTGGIGALIALFGCGGGGGGGGDVGGGGTTGGGSSATGAPPVEKLSATSFATAVGEITRRYPGAIPSSLAADLSTYTVSEIANFPGQITSMIEGNWVNALDRNGRTRINDFAAVNVPNSSFSGDLRTGGVRFSGIDPVRGTGVASGRDLRNGLQLDNGDLQIYLGFQPVNFPTGRFNGIDMMSVMVFGDVRQGLNGPIVGTSIALWQAYLGFGFFTSSGPRLDSFVARYRSINVRDLLGGPLGTRFDYDVTMSRVT